MTDEQPRVVTERDGRIYARGSADDKGQLYMHVKALEACLADGGKLTAQAAREILGAMIETGKDAATLINCLGDTSIKSIFSLGDSRKSPPFRAETTGSTILPFSSSSIFACAMMN